MDLKPEMKHMSFGIHYDEGKEAFKLHNECRLCPSNVMQKVLSHENCTMLMTFFVSCYTLLVFLFKYILTVSF